MFVFKIVKILFNLSPFLLFMIQNADVSAAEPGISSDMYNLALKLIVVIDNIEKQQATFDTEAQENVDKASILIFLPGIGEIEQMLKKIDQLCRSEG